jgi:hypothetical protein
MSRQITITRTELSLEDLDLNDPTNGYFVSDDWRPGGVTWERYEASTSPFAHGSTIVAQRKVNQDEIFTVYINALDPEDYQDLLDALREALSQFRYFLTINWDGKIVTYEAVGAGDIVAEGDRVDPILHRAGWHPFTITIPRRPE